MKNKFFKKTILWSICSIILYGCGGGNSYEGPVKGTAQELYTPSEDQKDNKQESLNDQNITSYGDGARFSEKSPSTLDNAEYISSPAIEYNFGNLVVNGKADFFSKGQPVQSSSANVRIVPIKGVLRYPQINIPENKKYPLIVFLHGQHTTNDPSYKGYDYLAKNLAEQGYFVVSIDANAINGSDGDPSSQSRAQLILGTIDKIKQLDKYGSSTVLDELKGKIDFDKIGIMGHSRGGQGISLAIRFNTTRFGNDLKVLKDGLLENKEYFMENKFDDLVKAAEAGNDTEILQQMSIKNINFSKTTDTEIPYNFRAAFALAPTDFEKFKGLTNVPYATLLPTCDGDVSDLQGSASFDNNRFSNNYDTAPKYQVIVRGANHNYFNSTWLNDDYYLYEPGYTDNSYCNPYRENTKRLTPADQRSMGLFIINSFMRYFVGNEQKFKSYWNGVAQLPSSACPKGDATCDERTIVTVQKQNNKIIQRYEVNSDLNVNKLGGINTLSGFNTIIQCDSYLGIKDINKALKCSSQDVSLYKTRSTTYSGGLVSFPDQIQLFWSKSNPTYQFNLNNLSTDGYDSLTFRVALPEDLGQEIIVELTDMNGKAATVNASDFSDALYTIPRKKMEGIPLKSVENDHLYIGKTAESLNMIALPLKAFKGIDTTYLKTLKFTMPKEKGTMVLNDIQLQQLRK